MEACQLISLHPTESAFSQQGCGLVSMQGLLLLQLGRASAVEGSEFLVAPEEPEVHLPSSAQQRLVQRVLALSTLRSRPRIHGWSQAWRIRSLF